MRSKYGTLLYVAALAALTGGLVWTAVFGYMTRNEEAETRRKLGITEEELSTAYEDLKAQQTRIGSLESDLRAARTALRAVESEVNALQRDLGTAKGNLTTTTEKTNALDADVRKAENQLASLDGRSASMASQLRGVGSDISFLQTQLSSTTNRLGIVETQARNAPQLSVTPNKVRPGDSITVLGVGFSTGSVVTMRLEGGQSDLLGTQLVAGGTWHLSHTIPTSFERGFYVLVATDSSGNTAKYPLTVSR